VRKSATADLRGGVAELHGERRSQLLEDRGRKLYLNYDAGVQKNWEKDIPGHIASANRNWPKVLEK